MKLWLRYALFALLIFTLLTFYLLFFANERRGAREAKIEDASRKRPSYFNGEFIRFLHREERSIRHSQSEIPLNFSRYDQCSMSTCFNFTKCLWKQPKVYVYPTSPDVIISPVYEKILRVIRDSAYFTEDPDEACLFVLSLDTTDRDRISDNYIKDLSARIDTLPTEVWNEGRNHLIFNLYYGTYPDYSQADVGFLVKHAIMAWASADSSTFREGFDISFPLFHKEHPLRVAPKRVEVRSPHSDTYLSTFKGKRYVYGIGSNTRDSLYHLHNQNSTIVLTTCRHNTDWKKFEDSRCAKDNREYDGYDYNYLLDSSTFCLTPRGRRLGSFRFLEALKSGCIPVVLSDGWELPFSELVDWTKAAVLFHEKAVYFTTDVLSSFRADWIAQMRLESQLVYHRYFASVEKIVLTSIQIVLDRLKVTRNRNHDFSTSTPINSPSKCTLVLHAAKRFSNRLTKIIGTLANLEQVEKFIVLWPKARGSAPEASAFQEIRKQVDFVTVNDSDLGNLFSLQPTQIPTEFIVSIDERIRFTRTDLLDLLRKAEERPNRLISSYALHHQLNLVSSSSINQTIADSSPTRQQPNYTVKFSTDGRFSIGLLNLAVIRKELLEAYQREVGVSAALRRVADSLPQCQTVLFNVFMVERTLSAPILVLQRSGNDSTPAVSLQQQVNARHYSMCLNKLARVGAYENFELPLLTSNLRHIN